MTDDNNKPNAKTQSIPSSVNPDAKPVDNMSQERDPDASAQEIVETIAKHVPGFEANPGDSPPQYLNHDQLVALKDEIQHIKDRQTRDNG